jgi:MerR family transcriptional regulator/heat shock protein HspR
MKRKKGYFSISSVAKMFSVHQQTIRLYEKEGLITPKRSEGNTRLFSEEDIEKLERIIYLTHKMGVNLSGVEMIVKLEKKIEKLQKQVHGLFEETKEDLLEESAQAKEEIRKDLSLFSALKTGKSLPADDDEEDEKQESQQQLALPKLTKKNKKDKDLSSDWHIEYDDEKD